MNNSRSISFTPRLLVRTLAVAFATAGLVSAASAAVSFPDYPLQSGAGSVPPNIMFILDNSGSMAYDTMAIVGANAVSPVDISSRTVVKNSLGYNPAINYGPWDTDTNGTTTFVSGGRTYDTAFLDASLAGTPGTIGGNALGIFYTLRIAASPDATTSYDRYRVNATGSLLKAEVTSTNIDHTETISVQGSATFTDVTVSLPANTGAVRVTIRPVGGSASGDPDLYVTNNGSTPTRGNAQCISEGNSFYETCELEVLGTATTFKARLYAYSNTSNVELRVVSARLGSEAAGVPASRNNADEVQNLATWYSFHRTRMKVAKAGASKAFIQLGSGYRLGFDTINADDGTSNTAVRFPIPVEANSGRFEGANRTTWFSWLQGRTSLGGTPLRSSLKRAGEYYSTTAPWADGGASAEQACRASYSLLSTDGYWNGDRDFTVGSGDVDGDGSANTLADVAKYYWQTDLRPLLDNNVPTTSKDTANWQHMGLFGVSIGLQGTLPVTVTPPSVWPDPTDVEDAERIDDLWHASFNGRGAFIVASQSDEYAAALRRALDNIKEQTSSGSNITANGNSLNSGSQIFQAMFTSRVWSGDIKAFDISGGGIAATPDWSLAAKANDTTTGFATRPVMTWFGTAGAAFSTATVPATGFARTGAAPATAAENVAYIKGNRTRETGANPLRTRVSPIGDIVNSSPFYLRELNTLFIGANDGMLHAVNSETGAVRFSYVPKGIDFTALASLSDPDYAHRFFVDGQIDVSTTVQGSGRNILAAALGRGGKGIFALDVTAAHTTTFTADKVLWDATGSTDANMGYVLGQPLVRKGNNGSTLVITGNGIESTNGKAVLYIYVLNASGTVASVKTFDTLVAGSNGMSEPRAADVDGDGTVDWIYAGDMKGNLWKIDVSDSSPAKWIFAYNVGGAGNDDPIPMFTARDSNGSGAAQPITGAVALAREPGSGRIFVSFGTGKLISQSDVVTPTSVEQTQSFYSLIDDEEPITLYTDLQSRSIAFLGTDSTGRVARAFQAYAELPPSKRGWYLNLAANGDANSRGERIVTAPIIRGRAAWFASIIPNIGAGCANTGKGFLNVIDVFTGTNPASGSFIDVNNNGKGDDRVGTSGDQPTGANGYVSSIDLGVAMPGQPAQIGDRIAVAGSNATTSSIRKAGGGDTPKRLNWRELINR